MAKHWSTNLSRRERQIMEIIYTHGRASAAEVLEKLPEPPGNSAVRAMLRILEDKGFLRHEKAGACYIFSPTLPREKASRAAVKNLVQTFFGGSVERAVAALLDASESNLTTEDMNRLARLIERTKKEGR